MTGPAFHFPFLILFLAGLLAGSSHAVASEEEADIFDMLRAMNRALEETTYRGVLVHVHDRDLDAIEIVHQGGADRRERLYSLTGEPREVIRGPRGVTCILPRQRTIMVDHSLPQGPAGEGLTMAPERLGRHYRFRMEGSDRVAGLETLVIVIEPRDAYRYGHRFWVDARTHLPLRSELFTHEGRLLARLMYASIEYLERLPDEAFAPRLTGEGFRTLRNRPVEHPVDEAGQPQEASRPAVRIHWVPPGFLRTAHRWHGMPMSESAVEHLLYSDGLASFSIYVEQGPSSGTRRLEGTAAMGSVHASGRRMGSLHVTVVGEVPAATVERVVASIEPEAGP